LTRAELANRAGLKEAAIGYIEDQPAMQRPEIVLRLA
jgi:transcriptional regulator with XRE-family HTH domain